MATPSELKPWLRTAALVYDEYHGGILGSKNDGAPLQLLRVAGMYPTDRAHMRRERTYFAQECWLVLSDRELIIWARLGEREIRTFDMGRPEGKRFTDLVGCTLVPETYSFALLSPKFPSSTEPHDDIVSPPCIVLQIDSMTLHAEPKARDGKPVWFGETRARGRTGEVWDRFRRWTKACNMSERATVDAEDELYKAHDYSGPPPNIEAAPMVIDTVPVGQIDLVGSSPAKSTGSSQFRLPPAAQPRPLASSPSASSLGMRPKLPSYDCDGTDLEQESLTPPVAGQPQRQSPSQEAVVQYAPDSMDAWLEGPVETPSPFVPSFIVDQALEDWLDRVESSVGAVPTAAAPLAPAASAPPPAPAPPTAPLITIVAVKPKRLRQETAIAPDVVMEDAVEVVDAGDGVEVEMEQDYAYDSGDGGVVARQQYAAEAEDDARDEESAVPAPSIAPPPPPSTKVTLTTAIQVETKSIAVQVESSVPTTLRANARRIVSVQTTVAPLCADLEIAASTQPSVPSKRQSKEERSSAKRARLDARRACPDAKRARASVRKAATSLLPRPRLVVPIMTFREFAISRGLGEEVGFPEDPSEW